MEHRKRTSSSHSAMNWLVRLVLFSLILAVTSYLTPGFSINGLWSFLLAAVVITVSDYIIEMFMGIDASPIGKGIKGFIVAALILYLAQYIVPDMSVSIVGSLLASLVIGIIDAILPGRVM